MKKWTSNEIRKTWLNFFEEKGHMILPSASLIPKNDKSLLWINSGVASIKHYFDGSQTPPSKKLANSQKAIRTGDIENIGITTRHHTFFEMLGNFSIGDYFKKESIEMAWELLTSEKYFGIDKSLLYITVYEEDLETIKFWVDIGVEKERIFKLGKDTNFWDMGKGPCGPSTEIFFDNGKKYDSRLAEELIGKDIENDRYIEIWNIVFSEFNNDGKNNYTKLPQKNIDTGCGLERLASLLQKKPSNFETDLFEKIIRKIETKTKYKYLWDYVPSKLILKNKKQFLINSYFKAISDFVRAISFAISDGASPSNSGRGYILRRLIRKSEIYKSKLEINENFLHELIEPIIEIMGETYPKLIEKKDNIEFFIRKEEEQFNKTLFEVNQKLKFLIQNNELNEENAFKLHETYGLPIEILKDVVNKNNLNWKKIDKLIEDFKNISRSKNNIDAMNIQDDKFNNLKETKFLGYEKLTSKSKVVFVSDDKVVFDQTPFFATAGGQESDFGFANKFKVTYVIKNNNKTFIHTIPNHNFKIGDLVSLKVDESRRKKLTMNHSGAHLLFKAIELELGEDKEQQGSKIEENYMRFDFALTNKFNEEQLKSIERRCKKWIDNSTNSKTIVTNIDDAKKMATSRMNNFDYGDEVRVVKLNDEVIDLCAGTHVKNTSEIEDLKIIKFEKKGSGIFRIEAITGHEMIKNVFEKINNELKEENLNPTLNKIALINKKYKLLNINKKINFDNEIKKLDITSSKYRDNLKKLNNFINSELKKESWNLEKEISLFLKNKINQNKIVIINLEEFNIQEIAKPTLSIIDQSNAYLVVIIIKNKLKVTFGFIIKKDKINDYNIKLIREFAKENNLRGNGQKQLYIFGGSSNINKKSIEGIKKWEF
ncbi:MAG: alanine--tRNA ligase [Candidatus Tyloplasma litorale]|nr:MAG: alanine--tRNA ligase [Mycoplasmatales bacterium]